MSSNELIQIILKCLVCEYFEKFNLFHTFQIGFRTDRSTINAVFQVISDIAKGLEEEKNILHKLCMI